MVSISRFDLRMIIEPASTCVEHALDLLVDLLDRPARVDADEDSLGEVVGDERLGLLAVDLASAVRIDLGCVVAAAFAFAPRDAGRRTASSSSSWSSSTASSRRPISRSIVVERLGLRDRPREAVEHEAVGRVGPRQPLADERDHEVVRDEVAAVVGSA